MDNTGLWLTPLILLPGVAMLVASTSRRYGRIHTEFHHLLSEQTDTAKTIANQLLSRAILFRNALVSLYICIGLLSVAGLVGGLASSWKQNLDWLVITLTFLGILSLVFASFELIRESITSLHIIRIHNKQITSG